MTQRPPHILFVVGARPNFMKVAPVYRAVESGRQVRTTLLHTGQHYDHAMSDVFFADLGLPAPDIHLHVGSGTHAYQTARALEGIADLLEGDPPELVVVAGDVNSTLAGALAAVKLDVPVAHIEAGLRSWDWTMPEEHNRRVTDHLSTLLFAHCDDAVDNLRAEGIDEARIYLVGNTMIDSLRRSLEQARACAPWVKYGLTPQRYGLVTLHRPSLVDDAELLRETVLALCDISVEVPVLFPVHPRTRRQLVKADVLPPPPESNVHIVEPASYLDFLGLEAEAQFVLTDSGGVQEETTALAVPCFTLRDSTERPVTVESGTNVLLGRDPGRVRDIPRLLKRLRPTPPPIPLWDGRAGERVATALLSFLAVPAVAQSGTVSRR